MSMIHGLRKFAPLAAAAAVLGTGQAASALSIDTFDSGTLGRGRDGSPEQAFVGPIWASLDDNNGGPNDSSDVEYNNYFKFKIPGSTPDIASANLVLEFPDDAYSSSDTSELFLLHKVMSDSDDFGFDFTEGTVRSFNENVYDDLASGVEFGRREYSESDEGMLTSIMLSAAAISEINNSRGGIFMLGGSLAKGGRGSVSNPEVESDLIFDGIGSIETDPNYGFPPTVQRLELTPAPSAATLGVIGFALIGACTRRRRNRANRTA